MDLNKKLLIFNKFVNPVTISHFGRLSGTLREGFEEI